jgi:hypothetical protein
MSREFERSLFYDKVQVHVCAIERYQTDSSAILKEHPPTNDSDRYLTMILVATKVLANQTNIPEHYSHTPTYHLPVVMDGSWS